MVRRTTGSSVDADSPLMDAGLDSLGAVELRNLLRQVSGEGVPLPSTLVFDYPSMEAIAAFRVGNTTLTGQEAASVP